MLQRMNKRMSRLRRGYRKVVRNAKEVRRSGGNSRLFHMPRRRLDAHRRLRKGRAWEGGSEGVKEETYACLEIVREQCRVHCRIILMTCVQLPPTVTYTPSKHHNHRSSPHTCFQETEKTVNAKKWETWGSSRHTLRFPFESKKRFSGLMSRWATPWEWR